MGEIRRGLGFGGSGFGGWWEGGKVVVTDWEGRTWGGWGVREGRDGGIGGVGIWE